MKVIKYFSLTLFSLGIVGCSQTSSTTSADNSKKSESTTAATEVFKSKLPDSAPSIKVATTGTMSPFSVQDTYGNMTGFDIDIIRAIGEVEGFRVNFFKEPWQTIFTSVESGKTDMALSAISYKPERAEKYNLSNSYFYNPSAIMYKNPQLNIKGIADLKGLRVGGMKGTKQLDTVKEANIASSVLETKSTFLLYQALVNDKVDAIVQDYPLLKDTANHHPEYKVTIVPYENRNDPLAQQVIVMKKGNDKLLAQVNEGIEKIRANGELKKIEDKWKVTVEDDAAQGSMASNSSTNATHTVSATTK